MQQATKYFVNSYAYCWVDEGWKRLRLDAVCDRVQQTPVSQASRRQKLNCMSRQSVSYTNNEYTRCHKIINYG